MARKKKHEEHENHERWLVSYADFITLLFAFFTSMYAISTANEGKFRALSESIAIAFNPSSISTISRITSGPGGPGFAKNQRLYASADLKSLNAYKYQKIQEALKDLQKDKKLSILMDEQKITIRVPEGMLFESGSDEIMKDGLSVLNEIAGALKDTPNLIRIEGHTDNIPINTPKFPSNWDLSGARAIKILKYMALEQKIDPSRLSAIGYGEYRPIVSNDTPAGRSENRRVDISIMNPDSDSANIKN